MTAATRQRDQITRAIEVSATSQDPSVCTELQTQASQDVGVDRADRRIASRRTRSQ